MCICLAQVQTTKSKHLQIFTCQNVKTLRAIIEKLLLVNLQVSLRWVYEQGASMVPKSFNKERMRQNIDIFDWSLTEEEINKINQLPQRKGSTLASTFGPHDLVLEIDADI